MTTSPMQATGKKCNASISTYYGVTIEKKVSRDSESFNAEKCDFFSIKLIERPITFLDNYKNLENNTNSKHTAEVIRVTRVIPNRSIFPNWKNQRVNNFIAEKW